MTEPRSFRTVGVRAAVLAVVAAMLALAACSKPIGEETSTETTTVITFDGESGTWKPSGDAYELVMEDITETTEVVTTHDGRTRRTFSTRTLIEEWAEVFGGDDPTAAIVLTLEDGRDLTVLVILSEPVLGDDGSDVTFRARPTGSSTKALSDAGHEGGGTLPAHFGPHSVVIDGGGATPPPATSTTTAPPTTAPATTTTTAPAPTPACSTPGDVGADPLKLSIVNESDQLDSEVYVTLTGQPATAGQTWAANPTNLVNTSVPLSCLPVDPDVPGGHAYVVELSQNVASGLLWISYGAGLPGLPTTQPSFDTSMTRFANVEFAYPGQGDMTNVDQFSFPVDLDTYASATATPSSPTLQSSHYNAGTCEIVGALEQTVQSQGAAADWNQIVVRDADKNFVRVVSPKQRAKQPATDGPGKTPNPYAQGWPSLQGYLNSMAGRTVTVEGLFSPGAGEPYVSESGWYEYTATFDADSNVTLTGTIQAPVGSSPGASGSVPGQQMTIPAGGNDSAGPNNLLTGLYDQASQYSVNGTARNTATSGATPNDVYNTIYRDFIAAFTYGYWGGRYGTSNSGFWQTWNPPASPAGGQPAFAAARNGTDAFTAWNIYAETMFQYSNNYNIPYGEDYGSGAPGRPSPLLDLPVGGTLRVTIGSDGPQGCLSGI